MRDDPAEGEIVEQIDWSLVLLWIVGAIVVVLLGYLVAVTE